MKIVIFGANGRTGSLLVQQALESGLQVIAYVRKNGSILIDHPKLKVVVGNLNETLKIKDCIIGSDACISALGSGSISKHATEIIEGIERIITVMEEIKVHRLIYLSSIGAGKSFFMMSQPLRFLVFNVFLRVPFADHNVNEQRIIDSNLQWTIVRPGNLTNGLLTGNFKHGIKKIVLKGNPKISRANVASFILKQITEETYIKKCVWLYE